MCCESIGQRAWRGIGEAWMEGALRGVGPYYASIGIGVEFGKRRVKVQIKAEQG